MKIRSLVAMLLTVAGLSTISIAPFAFQQVAAAAAPACPASSVVGAAIGKTLSGSPSMGSSSMNGVKATNCDYGSVVQVGYATPATTAAYSSLLATYQKGNPSTKTISGVGNGAFSYDITNNFVSSCTAGGKCTTTQNKNAKPVYYVDALKTGTAIIEISGLSSSLTLAQATALAKKLA